jgi:hypothetical protein
MDPADVRLGPTVAGNDPALDVAPLTYAFPDESTARRPGQSDPFPPMYPQ